MRLLIAVALLSAGACTSKSASESPRQQTPPAFEPVTQVAPSRLDGETFALSDLPYELRFTTLDASTFPIRSIGVWRGGERVADVELKYFDSVITLRFSRPLAAGSYALRFTVDATVDPEQLTAHFVPGSAKYEWQLRFFVGTKFCPVRVGLCPEDGGKSAALYVAFSADIAPLSAGELVAAMSLAYAGERVACEPTTVAERIGGRQLTLRCAAAPAPRGTATVQLGVVSSTGSTLEDCGSSAPLKALELPWDAEACTQLRWGL